MFRITDEEAPVFVQLSANGLVRNLALLANEERALVVGSTAGAAFRLTGPGIAAVQFHIERDKGTVWLSPAYRIEDLRLNSRAVTGPTPLEGHDVIEFAGVRLEVTIRDAEAFISSGDRLSDDHSKHELGPSYSMQLPSEVDATQLAMPASKAPEDVRIETQPASIRNAAERPSSSNATGGMRGTVATHPILLIEQPSVRRVEPLEPPSMSDDSRTVDTVRLGPLRKAPPKPVQRRPRGALPVAVPVDVAIEPEKALTAPSLFVRLGLLTKARPILVSCLTGFGAALLVFLLLAARRFTATPPTPPSPHPAPVMVAELNSLLPATLAPDPAPVPAAAPPSSAAPEIPKAHHAVRTNVRPRANEANDAQTPPEPTRSKALY
jgi:hypothetical protein